MKIVDYKQLEAFLDQTLQDRVQSMLVLRDRIQQALSEGCEQCVVSLARDYHGTTLEVRMLRKVLDALNACTFNLENSWGGYIAYMEDRDRPPRDSAVRHLSGALQFLMAEGAPASQLCAVALVKFKEFDDFLDDVQAEYGLYDDSVAAATEGAEAVFNTIAMRYRATFGRPGFAQVVPHDD